MITLVIIHRRKGGGQLPAYYNVTSTVTELTQYVNHCLLFCTSGDTLAVLAEGRGKRVFKTISHTGKVLQSEQVDIVPMGYLPYL